MNAQIMSEKKMAQMTVDIADLQVSGDPGCTLITYALGSCIAVILHDSKQRVGGMIHFMLPSSKTNPEKAEEKPAMFADTGVPLLFKKMYDLGCKKEDIVVKVAGGGKLYEDNGIFDIGKRNYTILRKLLWKNSVMIDSEDIGGSKSRTARLRISDGLVMIRSKGKEQEL